MAPHSPSVRGAVLALVHLAAGLALASAAWPALPRAAGGLVTEVSAPAPPDGADGLLGRAAGVVVLGCLGYLALVLVLGGLSALPWLLGRGARAAAVALTPALVRRLLCLGLGTGIVLAPGAVALADAAPPPSASPSATGLPWDRPAAPALRPVTVVVRPGDSLWRIAGRALGSGATAADVARAWPRWWTANRGVLGRHPDLIRPGQRLTAPATGAAAPTHEESR